MKTAGRWFLGTLAASGLLAAAAISGCSGFWDAPPNGGGGGTNPASGNFYVLNQKTAQIAGFAFAAGASSPTALTGSPYALGTLPNCIAIDPTGSFLYVGTATGGILLYTISSNGALTASTGGAISSDPANAMQVDPTGSWLVESVSGTGILTAIPLNSTTGGNNGAAVTVNLPATTLQQIAISPSISGTTSYAFVAMGTGGTAVVPFNSGNSNPFGTVQRITVKHNLGAANAVGVDPQNRLLYVGETAAATGSQSGGLRAFTIGSSSVTEITSGATDITGTAYPYSTGGTGPSSILPTSSAVYVSNSAVSGNSTGNITGFKILTSASGNTFSLASINTVTTGTQTTGLAIDSTSSYLLAVNFGGNPDLSTFTFDTTTAGQLDVGPTAATGADPAGAWAIAAAPQ